MFPFDRIGSGLWSGPRNQAGPVRRALDDGAKHLIAILVDKGGLHYAAPGAVLANDIINRGKEIGHSWVRLIHAPLAVDEHHGHTGAKGRDASAPYGGKTHKEGIVYLAREKLGTTPPKGRAVLTDPYGDLENPIYYLQRVFADGKNHGVESGHTANFEAVFSLTKAQFDLAKDFISAYDFTRYGGFKAGCGYFTAGLLDAAGIGAGNYLGSARFDHVVPDTVDYTLSRFTLKKLRLATPGTKNYERARHISFVYPDAIADQLAAMPEEKGAFYKR